MSLTDFDPDPSKEPMAYPGRWLSIDALMVHPWIFPIKTLPGRRLSQARVVFDSPMAAYPKLTIGRPISLRQALLQLNVARLEDRIPHIAVGSNANPQRLFGKLDSAGASTIVPFTSAKVSGLEINFLAETAWYGSFPTTPSLPRNSSKKDPPIKLSVAWLTEHQSTAIAETEIGYTSAKTPLTYPMTVGLTNGEFLEEAVMYWGDGAVLAGIDGAPVRLEVSQDGRIHAPTQGELASRHGAGLFAAASAAPRPSSLEPWSQTRPYGEQSGIRTSASSDTPANHQVVLQTIAGSSLSERHGDAWVALSAPDVAALSPTSDWLLVSRSGLPGPDGRSLPPSAVLARWVEDRQVPEGSVQVDQQVRDGLGLEIREPVTISRVQHSRSTLGDRLAPDPTYVYCRVQFAELVSAEKNVALVDSIAMSIIGAESGDEIVVEGVPATGSELDSSTAQVLRCRAISVDYEFQEERRALAGGDHESRFPDAATALGVYPDLPWIYLDQDARNSVGLNGTKLAVVRVRSSRLHLLTREIREILLLLAVTVLGLLTLTDSLVTRMALAGAVAVGTVSVVLHRLRKRVSTYRKGTPKSRRHRRGDW